MTLHEVITRARTMPDDERWKRVNACGEHVLETLPLTERGSGTPARYCGRCCSVFNPTDGVMLNPPLSRRRGNSGRYRPRT